MNKMDAYSKLFSIDDSDLDKKYYVRLLSTSDEVPQEVIDYIESFESDEPEEDIEVVVEDEVVAPEETSDDVENESDEVVEVADEDEPIVTEVEIDSDTIVVEEQEDTEEVVEPELPTPIIEVEDQVEENDSDIEVEDTIEEVEVEDEPEVTVDPIDILKDFYDHLKKASVYRKIRNSDNPDNLCKSVSSFCTRYLIELHSSDYDSELVRNAVSERVSVGEILRLLANYVEVGDLNSLAKSVIIIRNFLDKLDKEFNETDGIND